MVWVAEDEFPQSSTDVQVRDNTYVSPHPSSTVSTKSSESSEQSIYWSRVRSARTSLIWSPSGKIWARKEALINPSVVNWATNKRLSSPTIPLEADGITYQPLPIPSLTVKPFPFSNSVDQDPGINSTGLWSPTGDWEIPKVTQESNANSGTKSTAPGVILLGVAPPNACWKKLVEVFIDNGNSSFPVKLVTWSSPDGAVKYIR